MINDYSQCTKYKLRVYIYGSINIRKQPYIDMINYLESKI